MEVKVFNQFNPPVGLPNPVGDGTVPVFDYVEDKETGEVVYKEVGKSNLYELIQASKESTDINYIVERMSKGDNSLLNMRKGIFADVSELPKDVFELGEMSKTIKDVYEKDSILKSIYGSYEEYEKAFIEGKVFDAYQEAVAAIAAAKGGNPQPVVEEKKEEVKANEIESK